MQNIIREYVVYNNHQRPHQGIDEIPDGLKMSGFGNICKDQILGGLHHNYNRSSA